jgi:hypothetical protein
MFDPYWVHAQPYRVQLAANGATKLDVVVRNFQAWPQTHRIAIHAPAGLTAVPPMVEGTTTGEGSMSHTIELRAAANLESGVRIVAFDITRDGMRYGELFDSIVDIVA